MDGALDGGRLMRIRSIKPEFWRSDDIDRLDWHNRLLFIGLWSYVDDNGVGRDKVANVAADIFAGDLSVDPTETLRRVSLGLDVLAQGGQIARYSVDDRPFLHVTAWERHQLVKNPNKARYPLSTCANAIPTQTLRMVSVGSPESLPTGTGEQGNRGTGEQGVTTALDKSSKKAEVAQRFDEFWAAYDYKKSRVNAEQAWNRATRRAEAGFIIEAASRYAASIKADQKARGERATSQAYAATWLNGDRWNDELTKPASSTQQPKYRPQTPEESEERAPAGLTDEEMWHWEQARFERRRIS